MAVLCAHPGENVKVRPAAFSVAPARKTWYNEKKQEKALLRLLAEGAATAVMGIPLLRDFADVPFGSGYAAGRTPLTSATL